MHELADQKPLLVGMVGAASGVGSAVLSLQNYINSIFSTIGIVAGAVAATFSALILIKRYIHDNQKHHNGGKR